jgi:hypothetical protein
MMGAGLGLYISKCYIDLLVVKYGQKTTQIKEQYFVLKSLLLNETEKKSHYCKRSTF